MKLTGSEWTLLVIGTVAVIVCADSTTSYWPSHHENLAGVPSSPFDTAIASSLWQSKQGFFGEPAVLSTAAVVNATWKILGALATTFAFLIVPAIDSILAATSADIPGLFLTRRKGQASSDSGGRSHREARGILDYDRCIELFSCSVSSFTGTGRSDRVTAWTEWYLGEPTPGSLASRILEGRQSSACDQYRCNPISFFVRLFIYLTDWNTLLKV